MGKKDLEPLLNRIADALERLAPESAWVNDINAADAFIWQAESGRLAPVVKVNRIPIDLLKGIDRQTDHAHRARGHR